jgi:hypothetical protein
MNLKMRATGRVTMNPHRRANRRGAREKRRRDVRERNSRPVFSGSDMAERKRNSTGREVLPANPCGWLGSARDGDGRFDTAASNPAPRAQGEATKPAAAIAGLNQPHSRFLFPPFTAD